jgi:hypothetical protein
MAYHRMYRYTAIGRPLDPSWPSNKAVLVLMPLGAIVGAAFAWATGASGLALVQAALELLLIVFGSWALARELDPDDSPAAFISMAVAVAVALIVADPGILIVFATLALVRIVNRSTGMMARKTDSLLVMLLVIAVMYSQESPFFGAVAALAFMLDGSLKQPLRHQWIFALICLGGTVVYMVDHDVGLGYLSAPDALFEWLALLFLLLFALDTLLLKSVRSVGDTAGRPLDPGRVRGGMAVGLFAALQGSGRPESVAIIVAVIAGICIGMAFRKAFKAPALG